MFKIQNKLKLLTLIIILFYLIFFFYLKSFSIFSLYYYINNKNINLNINYIYKIKENAKNNTKNNYFFLKKEKLELCKNYGIFIYNYPNAKGIVKKGNIGDYIQSLASLQFLPQNCIPTFIDRDNFEYYNNSQNKKIVIMNSWNIIEKGNRKIPDNIYPIYISYHINNADFIDSIAINNLKKYQPIGCRDKFTRNALLKKGIHAYFSSCLTTTLDIFFSVKESERTNEIIFIDYKFGMMPLADKFIKSLNKYDFNKIKYITHLYILKKYTHFERFRLAKQLLDRYARAKLVVSTRIHGALPCLALNTPVIFINKEYDNRFPGLYELLNTIGINSKGEFKINVQLNKNNMVVNSNNYLKYSYKLKEKLKRILTNFKL